jgi:putative Holliday junction resolvase
MNRLVGIDYGRKRLGIATCDALGISVRGWPTIKASGSDDAVKKVASFVCEQEVGKIVLGLPLNMDGSHGEMADEVQRFAAALRKATTLEPVLWDERLTSTQAKRVLAERGKGGTAKGDVDRIAAALMLESYLRSLPSE